MRTRIHCRYSLNQCLRGFDLVPLTHKEKPNLTEKKNNNNNNYAAKRGYTYMKFERGEIVQKNNY